MTTVIIGGSLASGDEMPVYFDISLKTGNIPINQVLFPENRNLYKYTKQLLLDGKHTRHQNCYKNNFLFIEKST
jgi:hypothetical protein